MKDFFNKLLSFILSKPVFKGYGFTTGEDQKTKDDPTVADPKNLIFYKLRTDLNVFEIRHVRKKRDGHICYVIFNSEDNLEFEISKKWFDYLFEEVVNETIIEYNR